MMFWVFVLTFILGAVAGVFTFVISLLVYGNHLQKKALTEVPVYFYEQPDELKKMYAESKTKKIVNTLTNGPYSVQHPRNNGQD